MTDMSQAPVTDAPVLPDGTVIEDPLVATNALLRAVRICAENSAGEQRAAESKDYAAAALGFAQAIITLDPTRLTGGDTPQARKDALPDPTPQRPPTKDGDRDGQIGS